MTEDTTRPDADQPGGGPSSSRRKFLTGALTLGGVASSLAAATDAAGTEPAKGGALVNPRLFSFVGGKAGGWSVISAKAVSGDPLPAVDRVDFVSGAVAATPEDGKWVLRGVTSNDRYVTRDEKDSLVKKQAALGRSDSTFAALIPIRKSAKWWALTQDERRALFEEKSKHIAIGLKYLPGVARRLHHCRDLSEAEPFDFLTLFDYAKNDAEAFDDLVAALRATEEWKFVEREVDIRLMRVS
ncbi:MAG TPA: chlorite dismutase family protein [Pirellulaceae bacterium]|nr:chlorite dismutase family protein [Pirellulaceae bacterium]